MLEDALKATIGALLHDVGKAVQRCGGQSGTHSVIGAQYLEDLGFRDKDIIDCARYHHKDSLRGAKDLSKYAYITYISDNIASSERRKAQDADTESGFDKKAPLVSVFSLLNNVSEPHYYRPVTLDDKEGINEPQRDKPAFDSYFYRKIKERLTDDLSGYELSVAFVNSLLDITEALFSYMPSSTSKEEIADISLYDHLKLSAAISACICLYLNDAGESDYKKVLLDNEGQFDDKPFAILYSADISGIQRFIYTIHSDGALKSLRARSFYLELYMENLTDELLSAAGVSRANLLYSGGGHIYLLLPNTQDVKDALAGIIKKANAWLLKRFRADLFVANGYTQVCKNDLKNEPNGAYAAIFEKVSRIISEKKQNRYTASDIMGLNSIRTEGGECGICKTGLSKDGECELCAALIGISGSISKQYNLPGQEDTFFAVSKTPGNNDVQIAEGMYVRVYNKSELSLKLANDDNGIIRYYGKNAFYSGKYLSARLWVSDYCKEKEISKYAENSAGIERIGVLRMDVDNLGAAFTSGFTSDKGKYNTLSRTAVFSRKLSMFFKRDLNTLLCKTKGNVTVVYSGGDDLFIIGAWDSCLKTAIDINNAFKRYTQGKLTLSAGLGLYPAKFPIHIMARETGELEDSAKKERANGEIKNAIALFAPGLCFSWGELEDGVMGEKLNALEGFFKDNTERGCAFLYRVLSLIQGVEKEIEHKSANISLARYAYALARAEPETGNLEAKEEYSRFSKRMYDWMLDIVNRAQLKAAIYLYVYTRRVKK